MNFLQVKQIKGERDGQYPRKLDMFATFTEIGGLTYNSNQTPICKCRLMDDAGESHLTTLYTKQAIPPTMMNQRAAFRLYAFDTQHGIGFAGLWNDRAQVAQGSPQVAPQTPHTPPQATNAPQTTRDATGTSIERQCVIKAVAEVASARPNMTMADCLVWAVHFHDWIATGKVDFNVTHEPVNAPEWTEDGGEEIPF